MKPIVLLLFLANVCAYSSVHSYRWCSPSINSSESMPLGGGDIGLNVWVEKGDLLFYISRSGTYDEQNTLLKQGRVRLRLNPDPFSQSSHFIQELKMDEGSIEIHSNDVKIVLWVDVFKPVIHVNIESKRFFTAELHYENWRYRNRLLRRGEGQQNSYKWALPNGLAMTADTVRASNHQLTFYHHNSAFTIFDVVVDQQGLSDYKHLLFNPVKHLISGGRIICNDFRFHRTDTGTYATTDFKSWIFKTPRRQRKTHFTITLHTQQTPDTLLWEKQLQATIHRIDSRADRQQSKRWWSNFMNRSFIKGSGEAASVTRNYQFFRFMLGCNAFGSSPTKFNGGLFTFDPVYVDEKQAFTPDYRKWGGGTYTAQNQRLVYWPMLKSGDWPLMLPQFHFYRRLVGNAELRSKVYWGHAGACFTEQMENFGLPNPSEYGWNRPGFFDAGVEYNAWLEYQWETALEFCQMILESQHYGNKNIDEFLPFIHSVLTFFDQHYQHRARMRGRRTFDGQGKLIIYPASACETYKMAYNPTPTVAGLRKVLTTLGTRDSLLAKIPPIPYVEKQGKKRIAPALSWERINNTESPQLYPVFPWRFYGVGRPNLETALNTYWLDEDVLAFRSHRGWKQDNIWAACLGLTNEAKRLTLLKLEDGPHRFPAFWGPDFDWTPDHNRGGSGMVGLQEMLLQTTDEGKILLFPAWPPEWDVHFRLHAPGETVVEAQWSNGKLTLLKTYPEHRMNDVVLLLK